MADSTPLPGQFLAAARSLLDRLETQGDAIDAAARIIEQVEGLPPARRGRASTVLTSPVLVGRDRSQRLFDEADAEHARRFARVLRAAAAGS